MGNRSLYLRSWHSLFLHDNFINNYPWSTNTLLGGKFQFPQWGITQNILQYYAFFISQLRHKWEQHVKWRQFIRIHLCPRMPTFCSLSVLKCISSRLTVPIAYCTWSFPVVNGLLTLRWCRPTDTERQSVSLKRLFSLGRKINIRTYPNTCQKCFSSRIVVIGFALLKLLAAFFHIHFLILGSNMKRCLLCLLHTILVPPCVRVAHHTPEWPYLHSIELKWIYSPLNRRWS